MEFSVPNTRQQNVNVERAFAMLYGRVQAIMNYSFFEGDLRQKLWAECAKITTGLDRILIQHRGEKSNYKKKFGTAPKYLRHLRIFGEIGIVLTPKQEGNNSKIENKGKEIISNDHAGDVYIFFNLASKQIKIGRDVRWTGEFYANRNYYISIPNYNQNATVKITNDPRNWK